MTSPTVKRVAKIAQEYAGKKVAPGKEFDVEVKDLQLLTVLGRIETEEVKSDEDRQMTVQEYRTRAMNTGRLNRKGRRSS